MKEKETLNDILKTLENALLKLKDLSDLDDSLNYIEIIRSFIPIMITTVVDIAEVNTPNITPILYADIEAVAQKGGIHAIQSARDKISDISSVSVSDIDENDIEGAMNYVGDHLTADLFKRVHELPMKLRGPEILLRSVEALLANLLLQKFNGSKRILEQFCEHVGLALVDAKQRAQVVH